MPDKSESDRSPEPKARVPRKPPKKPLQDYSSLPQKPIKLKSEVTLPPVLKGGTPSRNAKKAKPAAVKKTRRKPAAPPADPLYGLSRQARDAAIAAAEQAGVTPGEWLENLILASTQPTAAEPEPPEALDGIQHTLHEISQRLRKIEHKQGFWRRFWEQYVEPYRRRSD